MDDAEVILLILHFLKLAASLRGICSFLRFRLGVFFEAKDWKLLNRIESIEFAPFFTLTYEISNRVSVLKSS